MYLLKEGRGAVLEFVRNLPSQAFLLIVVFVAGRRLFTTGSGGQVFESITVLLLFLLPWLLVTWANISVFLERFYVVLQPFYRASRLFKRLGLRGWGLQLARLIWLWNRRPWALLEMLVVVLLLAVGSTAVLISAMVASHSALSAGFFVY